MKVHDNDNDRDDQNNDGGDECFVIWLSDKNLLVFAPNRTTA